MINISPPGSPKLVAPDLSVFDPPPQKRSASGWDSPPGSPVASSSSHVTIAASPVFKKQCPAAPIKRLMKARPAPNSIGEKIATIRTSLTNNDRCEVTVGNQQLMVEAKSLLGAGEYFTVYRVLGGVIKIFNEHHKNGHPIYSEEMKEALKNTKTQYLAMKEFGISLVPILNIETMEVDGVIYQQEATPLETRWEAIRQKKELSEEDQNIVKQVKALFKTFYTDNTIPADMAPGNLAYNQTTGHVLGLDLTHQGEAMEEDASFTMVLRQTLEAFASQSSALHAYLDPRPR